MARNSAIRTWLRRFILGGLSVGALVAVFAYGFEVGFREIYPYRLVERVDAKIRWIFFRPEPKADPVLEATVIPTALLQLNVDVGTVDTGRQPLPNPIRQNGGGLTEFGGEVLLLPYNGHIYAASDADTIRDTGITAPDNNRAAYQALENDPDYAAYNFNPDYLRYNDLQYFQTADAHGLIASYTEWNSEEDCYTNTLARLDFADGATSIDQVSAEQGDWTVIFRTAPCLPLKGRNFALEGHMASGKLALDPSGTLYLSSGDFHWDGMRSDGDPIAQDPEAQYGKILALALDGTEARIFSMGQRNIQGLLFAPDGRLFAVEHGPQGGDELNIIRDGQNYGWPRESYGIGYSDSPIPNALSFGRHDTYTRPIHAWLPSVATSGVAVIGGFHPAWDGDLLVASLVDQSLYRVRMDGDRAVYTERVEIDQRIREIHQLAAGRIALWTDNQELLFLSAEDLGGTPLSVEEYADLKRLNADLAARLDTEIDRCAECHSFRIDDHAKAPSLARIFGDPIASTSYDGYTDALKSVNGDWTAETLTRFLSDTQGFATGTTMPGLDDPDLVEDVVDFLKETDWRAF